MTEYGHPVWNEVRQCPVIDTRPLLADMDVLVVGGGFTGLSTALHLLRENPALRVAVLEAKEVGRGATGSSSGMLTPGIGQSVPGLIDRVGRENASRMYAQTIESVHGLDALCKQEGIDAQLEFTGQLIVAWGPRGRQRLYVMTEALKQLSVEFQTLVAAELSAAVNLNWTVAGATPLKSGGVAAIRLPDAGLLHPVRLALGLADAVRARGGAIHEFTPVRRIDAGGTDRCPFVTLEDGSKVRTRTLVLATNGFTAQLGLQRGRLIPVQLHLAATKPLSPSLLKQIGWERREGIIDTRRLFNYFRLTRDGRVIFGGGRPAYRWGGAAYDPEPSESVRRGLARAVARLLPETQSIELSHCWGGTIGYTLDGRPVLSRLAGAPATIVAGGWCGHGIAMSIKSGAWIARIITDGRCGEAELWMNAEPPLLPTEIARWAGVSIVTKSMEVLDRI